MKRSFAPTITIIVVVVMHWKFILLHCGAAAAAEIYEYLMKKVDQ